MKNIALKIGYSFYDRRLLLLTRILIAICLVCLANHAFADDGTDVLSGDDSDAWATLGGTGKKLILLGEILVATITYVKTKNIFALTGVVIILFFIDIAFKLAGQS